MERKEASVFPQELLNLFDEYVHGRMSRRDFLDGAQKFAAVVGLTAAVQLEMLRPERNIERGTDYADHVQIGRRCHFRFWHECEVPRRPLNRRYRAKSGSDADIAKPTRLDPKQTCALAAA